MVTSRSFRVGKFTYSVQPMSALLQFDVLARITPIFAAGVTELIPFLQDMAQRGALKSLNMPINEAVKAASPVAKALAGMPDADRRFVIASCLSVCTRKADGQEGYGPVWIADAGVAAGDDINNNLSTMLKIVLHVLRVTYSDFFPESLSGFLGEA